MAAYPAAVSESKVSRWETGLISVPRFAVRRYEQLLGLPASSLSSTIDVLAGYMSPSAGAGLLAGQRLAARAVSGRSLEEFFEQVSSASTMTAAEWDDLTAVLASAPGLRLRSREWDGICSRLLVETVEADGDAWKPRLEAFNRLLGHPDGQQAAVAACAGWARCRENRVFIETVGLLDACRHPAAATAVLGQLADPTNEDAFAGALLACVRKVAQGDFSPLQLRAVADVTLEALSGTSPGHGQLHAHAAAVLTRLPQDPSVS